MVEPQGEHRAEIPPTPICARAVFGDRVRLAEEFVAILADTGISHGLVGPREAPRLWDRHVLNCAVTQAAIPRASQRQQVIDVGSGAGLPGLPIAIARSDLDVHLVEPLRRRADWLADVVSHLGLPNVTVHQSRAEALWDELEAPWVLARAVAGIVQLAEWTLPLLSRGGSVLALKGSRARSEAADHADVLRRLGVEDIGLDEYGVDLLAEPTVVLRLTIGAPVDRRRFRARGTSSAGSARRRSDRPRRSKGPTARPGHEPSEHPTADQDATRSSVHRGPTTRSG